MEVRARELIDKWLQLDRWEATREEASRLLSSGEYELICKEFNPENRVQFGTAGLRASYGAGFAKLNELVITQTAQAMYYYCLRIYGDAELKKRGVGLGYDARFHSKDFAEITAATFLSRGVRVYLFNGFAPTPYVSYLNKYYKCACGVMVTASHNPSKDNGYKVYGVGHGIQIIDPHDVGIYELSLSGGPHVEVPWEETAVPKDVLNEGLKSGLLSMITEDSEVMHAYREEARIMKFFYRQYNQNTNVTFRIGYSAMWGVGYNPLINTLERLFDFSKDAISSRFYFFEDECIPDPLFGGEAKPNPEERHNMVRLCQRAEEMNSHNLVIAGDQAPIKVILATDPDADRIAVAELVRPQGSTLDERWKIYHGNDIGIILANWCLENFHNNPLTIKTLKERGYTPGKQFYISNSTVSSKALEAMSNFYEDVVYEECLTGFKWIGTLSENARNRGIVPCFSYEESIGYSIGGVVTDKDGIATAGVLTELVIDLYEHQGQYDRENMLLWDYLLQIADRYGSYTWACSNISVASMQDVTGLFARLISDSRASGSFVATNGSGNQYITKVGRFTVKNVRDLQLPGWDTRPSATGNKPNLPLSKTPMLTMWCSDNIVCNLRPSGTEPKVKCYVECMADTFKKATETAKEFLNAFMALVNEN